MNDHLIKQLDELGMRARCAWPDEVDHEPPAALLEAAQQARHAQKIAHAGRVGLIAAGVMLAVMVGVGVHRSLQIADAVRIDNRTRAHHADPRFTDPDHHDPRLSTAQPPSTATSTLTVDGGVSVQPARSVEPMPISTEPAPTPITVVPMGPKPKPGEPETEPKPNTPQPPPPNRLW